MPTIPGALIPWIEQRFVDDNGAPRSGAKLFSYEAGTSTKKATYSDAALTTENTNPIVLDSNGRPPNDIYIDTGGYKFVLAPSDDTDPPTSPYYTVDNVEDIGQTLFGTLGNVFAEGGKAKTSGYTITDADLLVTMQSTGGADPCLVNLPSAASRTMPITIKNIGTIALSLVLDGSDTIDGSTSDFTVPVKADTIFPTVTLVSDGVSKWHIVSAAGFN